MPPNSETAMEKDINIENTKPPLLGPRKYRIAYRPVITFTYIHVAAIYGIYLCFTKAKWASVMLLPILLMIGELGITAGAHRLWAHRSYKAKMPLQIILMIFNSLAFQNTAIYWVRDHRQHHKYSDTDGDPHNSRRGFFYSHIGWLLTKKPAEVIECGKTIDMSDLYNNPVLRFQKKYALPLIAGICFIMPTVLPVYFWGETYSVAWHLNMLRYALTLNITFLVNSAAHMWGYRPYDMAIKPVQNLLVSLLSLGEGFHNYHHVFPWDYQTAELGNSKLNLTKWFIDFFAWVGWAYDLKTVPDDIVKKRGERTGDGTDLWGSHDEVSIEDYEKAYAKFDS